MKIVIDMQGAQSTGSRARGIGNYSVSLTKALVRNAGSHEVVLMLSDLFPETIEPLTKMFESLLPPSNIKVWHGGGPSSALGASRAERGAAEISREAFLSSLQPDVVLLTSLFEGLGDNAVSSIGLLPCNYFTAVIHYDLIPLIYRSVYLSNDSVNAWYERKLSNLRRANLLLAISEASRRDAIDMLAFGEDEVVNISSATDDVFASVNRSHDMNEAIRARYNVKDNFVLYTGGIDHRKNIERLIAAFALLPSDILKRNQLVIVCSIRSEDRDRLQALALSEGLPRNAVIFTGFIPEDDLVILNNLCSLFVFPSLYEGFGLPILEAMKCGATVIASNTSSMPEVVGFEDALFDPTSTENISNKILDGLTNEHFRKAFSEHALAQVEKFSWDKTAIRALKALEQLPKAAAIVVSEKPVGRSRPRLAYVSPLPPEQSGIADFSAELLPELARYYDIDVIVEQQIVTEPLVLANMPVRTTSWFRDNTDYYDRVIYHFGNSAFHSHMFDLLKEIPGVVVLHDFYLSGVKAHLQYARLIDGIFSEEVYHSHGYGALHELSLSSEPAEIIYRYPCNYTVLSQAFGLITHCEHSLTLAKEFYSSAVPKKWAVIPLARAVPRLQDMSTSRARLGIAPDEFVICCFGLIHPTKLNDRILNTWPTIVEAASKPAKLIFVGANQGGEYGQMLAERVAGLGGHIEITGWVEQDSYRDYLAAADIAVQLRTNSRGETSAAVLDCLAAGLPTVVNANGSMNELPDHVVLKLSDKFTDHELGNALQKLIADEMMRSALSSAGKEYVKAKHAPRAVAAKYFEAIERAFSSRDNLPHALNGKLSDLAGEFSKAALISFAQATARNYKPDAWQPQVLVDVSDHATSILSDFLTEAIRVIRPGVRIEPVYFHKGQLRYARRLMLKALNIADARLADEPVDFYEGDTFFYQPSDDADRVFERLSMKYAGVSLRPIAEAQAFLSSLLP